MSTVGTIRPGIIPNSKLVHQRIAVEILPSMIFWRASMLHRTQILAATEIVTQIPDEIAVTPSEVEAIVTVLRLLTRVLDGTKHH